MVCIDSLMAVEKLISCFSIQISFKVKNTISLIIEASVIAYE
jgi:hypothetical protein